MIHLYIVSGLNRPKETKGALCALLYVITLNLAIRNHSYMFSLLQDLVLEKNESMYSTSSKNIRHDSKGNKMGQYQIFNHP